MVSSQRHGCFLTGKWDTNVMTTRSGNLPPRKEATYQKQTRPPHKEATGTWSHHTTTHGTQPMHGATAHPFKPSNCQVQVVAPSPVTSWTASCWSVASSGPATSATFCGPAASAPPALRSGPLLVLATQRVHESRIDPDDSIPNHLSQRPSATSNLSPHQGTIGFPRYKFENCWS